MLRTRVLTVVSCLTLVALVLSPTILSAHAVTSYVPGVMSGQWAQYKVLYDRCHSTDPSGCLSAGNGLNDTNFAALQVVAVLGTSVTLQLITVYKNGTGTHEGVMVDVSTGSANITGLTLGSPGDYFVLATNLQAPDHIWSTSSAPTFNTTRSEMVLSQSRTVNFLNYSSSFSYGPSSLSSSTGFAFDQLSGVFIEISLSLTSTTPMGVTDVRFAIGMVDNNIWGTAVLPDFGISADPMTVNIVGSGTGTSSISVTRLNGFSATVKLTATPSSSSITCSLSPSSLLIGGSDTSTLSCAGSPGSYTVKIEGNGGYSVHDKTVAVSITSSVNLNPDFTISPIGSFSFQTGSSGTATVTINAQNGYGSVTNLEISSTPSGLTCNLNYNSVTGQGSATMTCSGQPGTYTVMVKGTGGGTSHTTQTTVTVSAAPAAPQPAAVLSPLVYGGIGVAAVVAALVAFLFLRRKPGAAVVAPGDVSTPATPA